MAIPTQDWAPPQAQYQYSYNAGVLNPIPNIFDGVNAPVPASSPTISILIKNIIDEDPQVSSLYSEYRLGASVSNTPSWLRDTCYQGKGFPPYATLGVFNEFIPYTNGMNFSFTPEFVNLLSLTNGDYYFSISFQIWGKNSNNEWNPIGLYHGFVINLGVTNQITPVPVTFLPETLTFNHTQGDALPSQEITIDGTLWEIVGKPNFVLSSQTVGVTVTTVNTAGVIHQVLSGTGEAVIDVELGALYNSDTELEPEDLSSAFIVKSDGIQTDTIPFTVSVLVFFKNPYSNGQKAFTLDQKFFEFASQTPNTYFQVDATIQTHDFFTDAVTEIVIPQKVVLFNGGGAKLNLGQIIHRLMHNFPSVNENLLQYKPALLNISCTEINIVTEAVVRELSIGPISFVAGLSRGITNLGFLDFNPKPNRVTKNSFVYLNILVPNGDYQLEVKKNGVAAFELPIENPNDRIVCVKFNFLDYNQGDLISVYLNQSGEAIDENTPKKEFYVFPEGHYSNTIVWENEFLVQSVLDCTDAASITTDFEFISQKTIENLVEKLNHLESKKEVKLFINTGWLAETDVDTIESLLRSKRAWLLNSNGNISLRPFSKKMINRDFKRELIEYSLEFIINRQYDEETYSF